MLAESELDRLASEVNTQLAALRLSPSTPLRSVPGGQDADGLPDAPAQRGFIERITGQPFHVLWESYRRHLRKDLCLPGGMLFEQWRKYRDIESKSAVRVSYAWVAAMGIPTASLAPAAVAAAVFLLNVLIKVGIDVVCEGCAQEGTQKAP